MRQLSAMLFALTISPVVHSMDCPPEMILDKIDFQVAAKQWVTTNTALLTVNISATLTNGDLVKARADILSKLAKIANGDWHLIQFDRSQDSSGLEKLTVIAETRMAQKDLTHIYESAKSVSKPGENYTVGSIEFKPGLDELQTVRAQLRVKLYQLVNEELDRINKSYGDQKYSLSNLVFTDDGDTSPRPVAARGMVMMAGTGASSNAPPLTVSNELTMTAMVEVASNRVK